MDRPPIEETGMYNGETDNVTPKQKREQPTGENTVAGKSLAELGMKSEGRA
jgi:hypothetical protein